MCATCCNLKLLNYAAWQMGSGMECNRPRRITQAVALFHVTHDSCAFHVTHDSCGNMIGIADQGIYNAFTNHVVIESRWCEVGRLSHE